MTSGAHAFSLLPFLDEAPLSIDIRRGNGIESSHLVDIAVVDCDGRVILGYGDTERTVFPRSAMKPLQAIALIEELQNKGLEADLSDELICVTCASHNGQPAHLNAVENCYLSLALPMIIWRVGHIGPLIRSA